MSKDKKQKNPDGTTDVLMESGELFKPSEDVVKNANIQDYETVYKQAAEDPVKFWDQAAGELTWDKPYKKVFDDSKKPFYSWFVGGKCNLFTNALERHQATNRANHPAILYECENGDKRTLTYKELHGEVNKFAAVLKNLGIKKGDRVAVYMPNIPEVAITMLACVKLGAVHSVVYAGFSAQALRKRVIDAAAKIVVTVDYSYRRGKTIGLKEIVDEALSAEVESVKNLIVVKHAQKECNWVAGRDLWWHDLIKQDLPAAETEIMDSEDPAFILYTSGTTGTPKGVVHSHGGYMVGVYRTIKWVFDLKNSDIYWCTADPGWITGHSYIVYGPLMAGVTSIMYEGVPDFPEKDRIWGMIERYKITVFYTAPTLVRLMAKYGDEGVEKHNLKSLRILGSVGEPINPEAWRWYYEKVGGSRCPIMDTWWQTETGMNMITPLPPVPLKPGSAYKPFPGIVAEIVDKAGKPVPEGKGGHLVISGSWPAQLKTLFHNPKRYLETYYEKIPGYYETGDLARKDKDGYFWIQGRSDDVLKISGHRISNAEIESAIVSHESVSEAGVIGKPHPIKGETAKAFVILKTGQQQSEDLTKSIKLHIKKTIGPLAVTDEIEFVDKLPKTRSGKIMRRILRAQEMGEELGDTSTLED